MPNIFKSLKPFEWSAWAVGSVAIIACFFAFGNTQYHYLVGALIGVAALVFTSKGAPVGQLLIIVFSVFYGIISLSFRYYGEMITYLGMSAPIALWAFVSWLRHPFDKNRGEVRVNRLSRREICFFIVGCAAVTAAFYFILRAFGTANIEVSTLSVTTSFCAAYLTARRSRFYAVFYAANDIVLIALWALASVASMTYLPMVVCFSVFLFLDGYGFVNWTRMSARQRSASDE